MRALPLMAFTCLVVLRAGLIPISAADDLTALRTEYFRLRNNDHVDANEREWKQLADRYTAALDALTVRPIPHLISAAFASFRVWREVREDRYANIARGYAETVVAECREARVCDAAAALLGDISIAVDKDEDDAETWYDSLEPGSRRDSRRLSLVNGTFFRKFSPSPELTPPILLASRDRMISRGDRRIVLDPGHGGEDPGAVSEDRVEKEITLEIAQYAAKVLRSKGHIVFLTRTEDDFLPLVRRTEIANKLKADIFLSLHVNSSPSGDLGGVESYYLDNTDDQASQRLADRENGLGVRPTANGDLSFILSDLIQSGKLSDSIRLASTVQGVLIDKLTPRWGPIGNLGVKRGPFSVLVGAHMPCALVEVLFANNPADGKRLSSRRFREEAGMAVAAAVQQFFEEAPVSASGRKRLKDPLKKASPVKRTVVPRRKKGRRT